MQTSQAALTPATCRPVTLAIVDDHALVRDSLAGMLRSAPGYSVLAVASCADEGIDRIIETAPDVVLMDIDMPGISCFDAIRVIRSRGVRSRFILFSAHINDAHLQDALDLKVEGFFDKTDGFGLICEAIRQVHTGGIYYARSAMDRLVVSKNRLRLATPLDTRLSLITPRERELLRFIACGGTLKDAAKALKISYKTADKQKASIMLKLGIHDKVELARFAIREGLVKP